MEVNRTTHLKNKWVSDLDSKQGCHHWVVTCLQGHISVFFAGGAKGEARVVKASTEGAKPRAGAG
jgi:hypothetical protein